MTMPDPVGVSGPGAMSQRVDKQPMRDVTGLPYGEAGALRDMQRAAPMAESGQPPASPPPIELGAPTERPDQPVTAGAALGPGPGPEALAPMTGRPPGGPITQALARAAAADNSGLLAQMRMIAEAKGL